MGIFSPKITSYKTRKSLLKWRKRRDFLQKIDNRLKWLFAGILCTVLWVFSMFFPKTIELVYSQGIYLVVRIIYDYTLGLIPYSVSFTGFVLFGAYLVYKLIRFIKFQVSNKEVSVVNRLQYAGLGLGSLLSKVAIFYFVGWGFNMMRMPVDDYIGFEQEPLNEIELIQEYHSCRKNLIAAHNKLGVLPTEYKSILPENMEDHIRNHLHHILKENNYRIAGRVRCKTVEEVDWLKWAGYPAVYVSFFGEALLSERVNDLYKPFYIAHEMAHGYGFFDEATANFFAYLACLESDNPLVRYSAYLVYYIYLNHEIKHIQVINRELPEGVMLDLAYYGSLGHQENYARMVTLVKGYKDFKLGKRKINDQLDDY
jgi:hypothetical protein